MKINGDIKTPVRGDVAPELSVKSDPSLSAVAQALAQPSLLADLDAYVSSLRTATGGSKLPPSFANIPAPASARSSSPASATVSGALQQIAGIYADGLVTEQEMLSLHRASSKLDQILAMRDDNALAMLPRDVRQRLDKLLFGPLEVLAETARGDVHRFFGAVEQRDLEALKEKLGSEPSYRRLDLHALAQAPAGTPLQGLARYGAGDLVALRRSDGSTSLGVVVGKEPSGELRVEVSSGSQLGFRTLDESVLLESNPLKIGDYIPSFEGKEIWIRGAPGEGVTAVTRDASTGQVSQLDRPAVRALAERMVQALSAARAPTLVTAAKPAPSFEGAVAGKSEGVLRAGGAETKHIETLERKSISGGLYTSRGPTMAEHGVSYKDYNEDAAVLKVLPGKHGDVWLAGAFDQAGGMGQIPGQTGAASRIAAEHLETVPEAIQGGVAPKEALKAAVRKAHKEIRALNEKHSVEAITTVASAVVIGDRAFVVNTGDSQVYHYDQNGKLKNMSLAHNLGDEMARQTGDPNAGLNVANIVTSAVGTEGEAPKIDLYEWKLSKGDYLVFGSDGISDANHYAQVAAKKAKKPWTKTGGEQVAEDIGAILKKASGAKAATKSIKEYALRQMAEERGKPDNTTVVVLQV